MRHVLRCLVIVTFLGCGGGTGGPDSSTAVTDAPRSETGGDLTCGSLACAASQVCVRTESQGGPCIRPEDGGDCPAGMTFSGVCCVGEPTFACAARPAACASTPTCACAASIVCPAGDSCSMPTAGEIDCALLAP